MRRDSRATKSHIDLVVLAILDGGPSHGYAIAQEINRRTGGALRMKEGTLYPLLHGMEAQGLLRAAWSESDQGPRRRVYQVTARGRRLLSRRAIEWRCTVGAVNAVLGDLGSA